MVNAVLDTNILVSATFWRGKPHRVLLAAVDARYRAYASFDILNEYRHVLQRDFLLAEEQVDARLQDVLAVLEIVNPRAEVHVIKEDPADDQVLACALEVQADYLVSGDSHLLRLGQYGKTRILTAHEFLQTLG